MGWPRVRQMGAGRHSVGAPKWAAVSGARTPAARCEICGREQFLTPVTTTSPGGHRRFHSTARTERPISSSATTCAMRGEALSISPEENMSSSTPAIREAEKKRVAWSWHDVIENNGHEARFCLALLPPGILGIRASRQDPEELPIFFAKNARLDEAAQHSPGEIAAVNAELVDPPHARSLDRLGSDLTKDLVEKLVAHRTRVDDKQRREVGIDSTEKCEFHQNAARDRDVG